MRRSRWLGHLLICAAAYFCGFSFVGGIPRVHWQTVASAQDETVVTQSDASTASSASSAADSEAYDKLISDAVQAYQEGRFAEARNQFRQAHQLSPTARTLRTIGMCSYNLSDYPDAMQHLDAALNERRDALDREKRAHVADLLAKSQMHVGRFRVRLSPANAEVTVDGEIPPRLSSGELLLEPGRHEIVARAEGYQPRQQTLQVDGGDRTTLELQLEPSPGYATASATSSSSPEAPTPTDYPPVREPRSEAQAVLGWIALGIGSAGLVAFGVTTGVATAKASSLENRCRENACGPSYHDDVDSYDRYKLLSTISLIGGLVFAGAGVTLLVTQPDDSTERAALTPLIGLGSVGVRGQL